MGLSPIIAQMFLYGDSLKNVCVAIIVPEEAEVRKIAGAQGKCRASGHPMLMHHFKWSSLKVL